MKANFNNGQKKVTSEKEIAEKKQNVIEQRKSEIKNASDSLFESTDFLNLENQISKMKVSEKQVGKGRDLMYKFERQNLSSKEVKRERSKIRKKRDAFADNIILFAKKKDEVQLKKEILDFKKWYVDTYILNDFSLISLSSNNRDKDTEDKLNLMLNIIKVVG